MSKRLGRGLDALIPSIEVKEEDKIQMIKLQDLRPNPYQPRKEFDQESIIDLKHSILEHGVIQPIIVKKSIKGYEIVAGERRFRASKEAGLIEIPAVVRAFTDEQMMEIALIENLQRENLNAIEIAVAYQKLMDRLKLTQDELAVKVGKSRPHVANILRLLQLPENVREYVSRGTLSMGHARALLGVKNRKELIQLAKKCIDQQINVRQLEQLVQKENENNKKEKQSRVPKRDAFLLQYEETLQERLGTSVKIKSGEKKSKIEIEFYSPDDLHRILDLIKEH
jgi:ParB family chromosome partitioning protein